jgi:hypothetical protein
MIEEATDLHSTYLATQQLSKNQIKEGSNYGLRKVYRGEDMMSDDSSGKDTHVYTVTLCVRVEATSEEEAKDKVKIVNGEVVLTEVHFYS